MFFFTGILSTVGFVHWGFFHCGFCPWFYFRWGFVLLEFCPWVFYTLGVLSMGVCPVRV